MRERTDAPSGQAVCSNRCSSPAWAGVVVTLLLAGCAATGPGGAPVTDRSALPPSAPSASDGLPATSVPSASASAGTTMPAVRPPASGRGGGYYLDDGPGGDDAARLAILATQPDPTPRDEPLHPRANRPYSALGNRYEPMTRREPFRQSGVASWYGRRYHGNATSTGEPYDMYSMTAAHPTLPLPSYVRVTNRANGRSVVVRVNDRGPFLRERVIDLSYLAAHKLDYIAAGSTPVDIEVLFADAGTPASASALAAPAATPATTATPAMVSSVTSLGAGHFLQLGAFRLRDGAEATAGRLRAAPELQGTALAVVEDGGFYRVKAGPWGQRDQAAAAADAMTARTGMRPVLVERR